MTRECIQKIGGKHDCCGVLITELKDLQYMNHKREVHPVQTKKCMQYIGSRSNGSIIFWFGKMLLLQVFCFAVIFIYITGCNTISETNAYVQLRTWRGGCTVDNMNLFLSTIENM
ncbi:hypothetical protein VPH35_059238 [Triticum aestivum]